MLRVVEDGLDILPGVNDFQHDRCAHPFLLVLQLNAIFTLQGVFELDGLELRHVLVVQHRRALGQRLILLVHKRFGALLVFVPLHFALVFRIS